LLDLPSPERLLLLLLSGGGILPRGDAAEAAAGERAKGERAEGERFGGDELLVTRKPSHKVKKSGGGDGKSYEETATAARRKGSGVKKKEASRGFGKPSSARR